MRPCPGSSRGRRRLTRLVNLAVRDDAPSYEVERPRRECIQAIARSGAFPDLGWSELLAQNYSRCSSSARVTRCRPDESR